MTTKKFNEHETGQRAEVGVWYCESCQDFHIKAGNVLLTFTKAEFSDFSNSVFNCYSESFLIRNLSQNQENFTFDLTSQGFSN